MNCQIQTILLIIWFYCKAERKKFVSSTVGRTHFASCGNHNSIVSHIQGIIRCRVVVRCIDMDVLFYKKKVHMSEKHTKLKVLTKIIIYPESLNAVSLHMSFNISIGGVFFTKKEL